MAAENFQRALDAILQEEGGKVDDKTDPGGRTNQGVTQRTYDAFRAGSAAVSSAGSAYHFTPRDVFDMEPAERDMIYRRYWDAVGGDKLPHGVDFEAFDAAINAGPAQTKLWMSRAPQAPPAAEIASVTAQRQAAAERQAADVRHYPGFRRQLPGLQNRIAVAGRFALSWAGPQPGAFDAMRVALLNSEHGLIRHHDRNQVVAR